MAQGILGEVEANEVCEWAGGEKIRKIAVLTKRRMNATKSWLARAGRRIVAFWTMTGRKRATKFQDTAIMKTMMWTKGKRKLMEYDMVHGTRLAGR